MKHWDHVQAINLFQEGNIPLQLLALPINSRQVLQDEHIAASVWRTSDTAEFSGRRGSAAVSFAERTRRADTDNSDTGARSQCTSEASAPSTRRHQQPLDTGRRKKLAPDQLTGLMRSLLKLLDAEYHAINSHNLGVQSGTAVIENLLVRRLHALCAKVHLLMVLHDDCSDAMAAFCAALRPTQLNRIQVCAPLLVPATVLL